MQRQATITTVTEIRRESAEFTITCTSMYDEEGNLIRPIIMSSEILDEPMIIDSVEGVEGELVLTYRGDVGAEIEEDGSLRLDIEEEEDSAEKYSKEDDSLVYEGGDETLDGGGAFASYITSAIDCEDADSTYSPRVPGDELFDGGNS